MAETIEITKKRLLYRSLNRGCKETDLLLGKFAKNHLATCNASEANLYEKFLDEYDGDIYNWLCGTSLIPSKYMEICQKISTECKI